MEERTRLLEREREDRARAAVAAERLRIARELHDIVAHSMSVVAVQAGVGRHVIDTDVAAASQALEVIETTSRDALVDLRRMLGVLRRGDEVAATRPMPGLADIPALVAETRAAGLGVTLESSGTVADVPAGVNLAAYRSRPGVPDERHQARRAGRPRTSLLRRERDRARGDRRGPAAAGAPHVEGPATDGRR